MKIIHTADLHLDSRLETNVDPIKAKERKRELILSFENLVEYAKKNDVDAILISGDFFDKPKSSVKTREYILNLMENAPDIQFFVIYGAHDDNAITDQLNEPANLRIFGYNWETVSCGDFEISGISGENISPELYDKLVVNPNRRNILMLHGDVTSMKSIPLSKLKDRGIDYLALGQSHKYKKGKLDDRGVWVYPGCLEGRTFDDEGQKGFVLIESRFEGIFTQFIPFARRTLHDIPVDISTCDTWTDIRKAVTLKLNDIPLTDLIRVRLTGNYDLDLLKQNESLEQSLNQQYFYATVLDEAKLRINPRDYENDISLKGEFIRNVLASSMSDEEKVKVIEYGIKALMKEEF